MILDANNKTAKSLAAFMGLCMAAGVGHIDAMAADFPAPDPIPDASAPAIENQWTFAFSPYLWAAGLEGNTAQFGLPTVGVDLSFSDVLSNLDFGFIAVGEVRYGRFGLFSDFVYTKLSTDRKTTPGPLFSTVQANVQSLFFTPMLSYRLIEDPAYHLDAMAGVRVWSTETRLSFATGILPAVTVTDNETWVDPTIGMKGRIAFGENFYFTGWGIVGGFGASSDFMWDAFGGIGYQVNDWLSVAAGYRGTGVDYSNSGFVYDTVQHGPMFGAVFRF